MILSIAVVISLLIILVYSMQSSKEHFKKINQQAYLMAKAREKKTDDDDRWIPYSQIQDEDESTELNAIMAETDKEEEEFFY